MKPTVFLILIAMLVTGFNAHSELIGGPLEALTSNLRQDFVLRPEAPNQVTDRKVAQGNVSDPGGSRRMQQGFNDRSGMSGGAGPQGHVGLAGVQGPIGTFTNWTPYQRFSFDADGADIRASDLRQASDITAYMMENPTARLGIDGSSNAKADGWRTDELTERRVSAVRDALIQAGTPSFKIQTGPFGDPDFRRENQVEVLLITVR